MSRTAFFYGTLMARPVLRRVIERNVPEAQRAPLKIQPAILHGFQRRRVKCKDYPAIIPANSTTTVRGTLVSGLTDDDIRLLDLFEGDEYARRKVKVRVLGQKEKDGGGEGGMDDVLQPEQENMEGEEVEAESYIWIAGQQSLESEEWDFSGFVRDKMSGWIGHDATETDKGFQDVDDVVAAFIDPTGGRGANGSITWALEQNGKAKEGERYEV